METKKQNKQELLNLNKSSHKAIWDMGYNKAKEEFNSLYYLITVLFTIMFFGSVGLYFEVANHNGVLNLIENIGLINIVLSFFVLFIWIIGENGEEK